jgi:hypothetical protein
MHQTWQPPNHMHRCLCIHRHHSLLPWRSSQNPLSTVCQRSWYRSGNLMTNWQLHWQYSISLSESPKHVRFLCFLRNRSTCCIAGMLSLFSKMTFSFYSLAGCSCRLLSFISCSMYSVLVLHGNGGCTFTQNYICMLVAFHEHLPPLLCFPICLILS